MSCLYEQKWWTGIATEIDADESDVQVKFMHPNGPVKSFHWPQTDDICWVPLTHILLKIKVPVTISGRQYTLDAKDIEQSF